MKYPILAPRNTWYKGKTKRSAITLIKIEDSYTPTGAVMEQWDASEAQDKSINCYVEGTKLTIAGNGSGKIQTNKDSSYAFSDPTEVDLFLNVTEIDGANTIDFSETLNAKGMFYRCQNMAKVEVSNWNTSKLTSTESMFEHCLALQSVDLSKWNVSNVTSMTRMFAGGRYGAMQLTSIGHTDDWNVKNVTSFAVMFQRCNNLLTLNVEKWNVEKVATFAYMLRDCFSLQEFKCNNWNLANCVDLSHMFENCKSLKSLNTQNWDTKNVTDMARFASGLSLSHIDLTNFDVSKVESFSHLFSDNPKLKSVNISTWRTSSVKIMSAMFNDCPSLTYVDLTNFDTSKCLSVNQMFERCTNLKAVQGLENFNTTNVYGGYDKSSGGWQTAYSEMFSDAISIEKIDLSSFDLRQGINPETNKTEYRKSALMLSGTKHLKKIIFGPNFDISKSGLLEHYPKDIPQLPTPDPKYIPDADGYWYDASGKAYTPEEAIRTVPNTYWASKKEMLLDTSPYSLDLKINNQTITIDNFTPKDGYLVSNSKGEYVCNFKFDEAWDDLTKTAVFVVVLNNPDGCDSVKISESVILENDRCILPSNVLVANGRLRIGVFGTKKGIERPTVYTSNIYVRPGAIPDDNIPAPDPNIYMQILRIMEDTKAIAQSVRDDADAGKFDGKVFWNE